MTEVYLATVEFGGRSSPHYRNVLGTLEGAVKYIRSNTPEEVDVPRISEWDNCPGNTAEKMWIHDNISETRTVRHMVIRRYRV